MLNRMVASAPLTMGLGRAAAGVLVLEDLDWKSFEFKEKKQQGPGGQPQELLAITPRL